MCLIQRFNPNKKQSHPPFAYLPFGGGPRHCIGKCLAMLMVKMTLVAMLEKFHFKPNADTQTPLEFNSIILAKPKNGIRLSIVANSP